MVLLGRLACEVGAKIMKHVQVLPVTQERAAAAGAAARSVRHSVTGYKPIYTNHEISESLCARETAEMTLYFLKGAWP